MLPHSLTSSPPATFCCLLSPRPLPGVPMSGLPPLSSQITSRCGIAVTYRHIVCTRRSGRLVVAAFGEVPENSSSVFPRINVRDPYQRLGISREASVDEIQAARNFLVSKYANHKPSLDAIESAHDKIILQSFLERRNPKIDIRKKLREVSRSPFLTAISSRFRAPSRTLLLKTTLAFIALAVLTVLYPTEDGPTLQVAVSLAASVFFIHERLKSRLRSFLYGVGSFFMSWAVGTFLMVSVVPPLLQGPRSLEVSTSLITYILLWVSSTYLQ